MYNELRYYPKIRILIIYTADVTRNQTQPDVYAGAFSLHLEEAFLSEINGDEVYDRVSGKIRQKQNLDSKDLMQLIVYPLTYRQKEEKQNAIRRTIKLLSDIDNDRHRLFTLKGLLVFCDKVILSKDAAKIRRMLMLTKVEQIIEKEKQEAIEKAVAEATAATTENVTVSVTQSVTQSVTNQIALNLLKSGSTPEFVAENTQLPLDVVLKLKEEL